MKSVAFLRNTWKKWEHKTFDGRDSAESTTPRDTHFHPRTSAAVDRSLTVTVKHLPLDISTVETVEGSWLRSDGYQPPSPIYDQFTRKRSESMLSHRDSSRAALDVTYSAHASVPSRSAGNTPTPPIPTTPSSFKHSSSKNPMRSTNAPSPWKNFPDSKQIPVDSRHQLLPRRPSPPSSPHTPSLPSYQVLPPIDLNCGPGSRFESNLEAKICRCSQSRPQSRHQSHCPKYTFLGAHKGKAAPTIFDTVKPSQKTVHALLDLSVDSKPRSLYHLTSSSPHLPMKHRNLRNSTSEHSLCSTEGSDADFPLSLFPAPPPLIIRKKIPAPLILRPVDHTYSYSQSSSVDSTPVGTPTTPRFHSINFPSRSVTPSPSKKPPALRPSARFSPPPFSPPNSPLPSIPMSPRGGGMRRCSERHLLSPEHGARPLRAAQSSANLRAALPFPATHRLTSSEPISDQSSSPIKRPLRGGPARPRPEAVRASEELQAYTTESREQAMPAVSASCPDNHVQWGYAL